MRIREHAEPPYTLAATILLKGWPCILIYPCMLDGSLLSSTMVGDTKFGSWLSRDVRASRISQGERKCMSAQTNIYNDTDSYHDQLRCSTLLSTTVQQSF